MTIRACNNERWQTMLHNTYNKWRIGSPYGGRRYEIYETGSKIARITTTLLWGIYTLASIQAGVRRGVITYGARIDKLSFYLSVKMQIHRETNDDWREDYGLPLVCSQDIHLPTHLLFYNEEIANNYVSSLMTYLMPISLESHCYHSRTIHGYWFIIFHLRIWTLCCHNDCVSWNEIDFTLRI